MQDPKVNTFLTVCQTLNYTRAAEELHITQPAVSQHISALEKEYGAALFEYKNRKLFLTKAGLLLKDALLTMVHDEAMLRARIHALNSDDRIDLKVGMTFTAGKYIVAPPLAKMLREHPEIRISIHSGDTERLLNLLNAGQINCAFIEGIFDKKPYEWDRFSTERLICACAPSVSLGTTPLSFDDLLGMQLFVREEGSGSRAVLVNALKAYGLSLDAFAETCQVESLDIIKILLHEGLGISFIYEAAIADELAAGSLVEIPLIGAPITHDISFIRLKNSTFEPEFRTLFDEITKGLPNT